MTRFNLISFFIAIIILGVSCSIDDDSQLPETKGVKNITEGGMKAKIDSISWKAFNFSATIYGKQLIIYGLDSVNGSITIHLNDTIKGQPFYINYQYPNWAYYSSGNNNEIYTTFSNNLAGGSLFIDEFNRDSAYISGSFIFYLYNGKYKRTIKVREGIFNKISYTVDKNFTKGLRMYMNNKNWQPTTVNAIINNDGIIIKGQDTNGRMISINLLSRLKGVYILNSSSQHYAKYITSFNDTTYYSSFSGLSSAGCIVVSDITNDSIISGSFILSLCRKFDNSTINFTEGMFLGLKLQKE
mgnify:CR=1 FL=1